MVESFYQQAHRLRDGAVMVYRRGDTNQQVYQARLKIPGVTGYIIRSLKTRDLPTAPNLAEDLFYELRAEQKLSVDVRIAGNLKFKDLWKRFYSAHETGQSIHRQRLHKEPLPPDIYLEQATARHLLVADEPPPVCQLPTIIRWIIPRIIQWYSQSITPR
ncbi:MAG: hypothetical protein B7Z80_20000 [Rhodospirillales bacterium 20-64-7]|nr:MAG: hypothetical protein B7Z80_20000 [Rhodospirillales bacterium 20-64-7]